MFTDMYGSGADPGFWSAAPKAIGICIVKQHFEHNYNQVSMASYTT